MKFGIFDYIDASGEDLPRLYDQRIELVQAAEAAGFTGYHLSEHHATPLSMTPSPTVFLAALSRVTQRIRLGTLLYLLPLYHPLRLLEEMLMLDNLSRGRLDLGVGRGISPHEFAAFGADFATSQAALDDGVEILRQGFTQDRVNYQGSVHSVEDFRVVMRPVQTPHPPMWYGLRIGRGTDWAARMGIHGVALGPSDRCAATLAQYRAAWITQSEARAGMNSPVIEPNVGLMRSMFIADTDEEAERIARPAYQRWFENLQWLWVQRGDYSQIVIAGDYDQARRSGSLIVGGPDRVRREMVEQAESCQHNYLTLLLAWSTLGHAAQMKSLDLFTREVMPALALLNTGSMAAYAPEAA